MSKLHRIITQRQNESFVNTSRRLLKNRNKTFPAVCYFTWKLQLVPNGPRTIAPEENCPPTPILTLTLNQTLTLPGGNLPRGQLSGHRPKYFVNYCSAFIQTFFSRNLLSQQVLRTSVFVNSNVWHFFTYLLTN